MKKTCAIVALLVGMIAAAPAPGNAENRTVTWSPSTTYSDGTSFPAGTTVTYDVFWSVDPALSAASLKRIAGPVTGTSASFDPDAQGMPRGAIVYFTADAVLNTGAKSVLAAAYTWTVPTLTSLSVTGPSSVNENSSATYAATATWSNGTTTSVTPVWSENSSYASISAGGVLTTTAVTLNQPVTVTASYTTGGVTRTASASVTVVDVAATLSSLAITGPSSVNENSSATYAATATWSDGTTTSVTPVWSENSSYASISAGGVLTATAVTANQAVTVTASYTAGSVTRTASASVTILDVPATLPAAPENIDVSGPVSTSPSKVFRLKWDPVTTYADGTPIPAGGVTYTAYWTTDPALSAATLQPLASPTSTTSVDFDPAAHGMSRNERVYLATKAALSTGQQSPLSAPVPWRASNSGPLAPKNGRIYTK